MIVRCIFQDLLLKPNLVARERKSERERERATTISLCSRSCANLSDDFTLPASVKRGVLSKPLSMT